MCGINGILYFNNFNSDKPDSFLEEHILKMNAEISHRGPDGEGVLINYPLCFGHRRLSIIDLSIEASQPMFNEDKSLAIIYNGEIYNYLELIPGLQSKGHKFKTKSDTEVILHSYEEYGQDCVNRFNGMWAFAIYDFRKKILFASRDRFGVKPFYYYLDNHQFVFSSEIKSLLKVKNITEANPGKVYDYLAYGYRTNNGDTFFNRIKELKPAHNLLIENENVSINKYWDFKEADYTGIDLKKEFEELLYDSVKIRFRSDVPVSILLSGGIDSGIIAVISNELAKRNEIFEREVKAYSAVFPGFKSDESKQISETAASLQHIKSITLTPTAENLLENLEGFVYGMGEPVFSTTSFAHFLLMKEIKNQKVKVTLNGQGADEAWCGYGKYIAGYFLLNLLRNTPSEFFAELRNLPDKNGFSYAYLLGQIAKSILSRKHASYFRAKYKEKMIPVLRSDFVNSNYDYLDNPELKIFSTSGLNDYLKYNIQYQGFNQILHYEDHSSMQNSVEIRSPFIDYRIMEMAFCVPLKSKIENGVTKKLLRDVFKGKLPASVIESKSKIGFLTPFEKWLEDTEAKKFTGFLLNSESFNNKKIWDQQKIRKFFNQKKHAYGFPIWRIINLELWSKLYRISNL